MNSLKVKKVEIKDSKLRNLRKGLRQVLKLAVHDKFAYYTHLENLYREKRIKRGNLTPSQLKRTRELSKLKNKLNTDFQRSVCHCSSGYCLSTEQARPEKIPMDLDMVWVPWMKSWYCGACFEAYYRDMTIDDFIEGFGELRVINPCYVKSKALKYKDSFLNKTTNSNYHPEIDEFKPWLIKKIKNY